MIEQIYFSEFTQGVENLGLYKHLHVHVDSSLFIIAKTWKQPRFPSMTWNYGTDDVKLFNIKKKWAIKQWKDIEETYMYIAKWKKPIWKVTYCMILAWWLS